MPTDNEGWIVYLRDAADRRRRSYACHGIAYCVEQGEADCGHELSTLEIKGVTGDDVLNAQGPVPRRGQEIGNPSLDDARALAHSLSVITARASSRLLFCRFRRVADRIPVIADSF